MKEPTLIKKLNRKNSLGSKKDIENQESSKAI